MRAVNLIVITLIGTKRAALVAQYYHFVCAEACQEELCSLNYHV